MAKTIEQWFEEEVRPLRNKPISRLSELHFFRDPPRSTYLDTSYFFAPADGIVMYQKVVNADEPLLDIKGAPYSLSEAMRGRPLCERNVVIGIFMTFFDVHINRIPYSGRLSYQKLDPIDTYNHPMLDVERSILDELHVAPERATYLRYNERMLNRIDCTDLKTAYHILQIADYDVDMIIPFNIKQNEPCHQGERFSQIRFGSQVDLIVPMTDTFQAVPVQPDGLHVEAGVDPLLKVILRPPL